MPGRKIVSRWPQLLQALIGRLIREGQTIEEVAMALKAAGAPPISNASIGRYAAGLRRELKAAETLAQQEEARANLGVAFPSGSVLASPTISQEALNKFTRDMERSLGSQVGLNSSMIGQLICLRARVERLEGELRELRAELPRGGAAEHLVTALPVGVAE